MHTSEILAAVDEEIGRLEQIRNLLVGSGDGHAKRGRRAVVPATAFPFGQSTVPAVQKKRRKLSAAGRARIAAAQKARWAKLKKANGDKAKNGN